MTIDRQKIAKQVKVAMNHSRKMEILQTEPAKLSHAKTPAPKLILSRETKEHVDEILAPLVNPELWKSLKLPFAPYPHAIVRMEGQPGTGKTALANYMARKFKREPIRIDFANVANPKIGGTEQNIIETFAKANEHNSPVIIMEECDAILWSRSMITEDTMHYLGFVNTLLTEIDNFKNRECPSLLILTTNYPKLLDEALLSRITDTIILSYPKGDCAIKLWESKLPKCMLDKMDSGDLIHLAMLEATPRQIENAILRVCRKAMLEKREPSFADFQLD